jgi:hypothetical protein
MPDDFSCVGYTGINAFTTKVTYVYIGYRMVFRKRNCLISACLDALTAPNTSVCSKAEFGMFLPAFGILAPLTIQRAAFEENRSTDARPVVNGVFLDVKYKSGRLDFRSFGSL